MSRLKELRLHGFKTFADPTRFVFERGVTAVIGPNGSGKSNMADAVRWVLGEQSNRSLRTRRADDVIFAGSQGRRPLGMAEAVLTLDNSDRWLPIEFEEVSIGRRAYRSGETEYLVNGARARLKDVVDLLAGGRLGANELVVVGQGTVDAALSLRPEERRQLFEEAAGVKNLQVRKNEALGRLARARDNLVRVGDLVSELKPQVRRLALQAQHQQEHDALGRRARALVVEAHRRREVSARASLGEARRRLAAAESALEAMRSQETAGRDAIAAAEARYWAAEAAARAAAERREASREASIRAETNAAAIAQRHADLTAALARDEAELTAVATALDAEPERDDPDAESKWRAAGEAERAWREAVTQLEQADRLMDAADEALAAARTRAGAWIVDAARHDEAAARVAARVEHLEAERVAAGTATTDATAALAASESELAAAEATEAMTRERLTAGRASAEGADAQADLHRARATALAERIGGLRAEMEALRERADMGGRLATTLVGAGWQSLMDAIAPPESAWAAIEAVVGGELQQALLWRDGGVIEHAADARGAARLLVQAMQGDDDDTAARSEALRAVGATRTLAEWIGADGGVRLFARTAVAADLAALLQGWQALPAGWCAVTADGDLADARGMIVIRGRREGLAGEAARQHARQREVADLVEQLDAEQREAGQVAAQALVAATAARRERDEASRQHADAERQSWLMRAAHARAAEALSLARDVEARLVLELEQAREALAPDPSPGAAPIGLELEQLAASAAEAHQRHDALAGERDGLRAASLAAQSAADAVDARLGDRRYRQAVQAARRDQLMAAVELHRSALTALEGERAVASGAITAAAAADAAAAEERAAADAERDQLRADLLEGERARGGAVSELAALERGVQAAAIEAQRLDDEIVAIGRERDLAIESLPTAEGAVDSPSGDEALPAELAAVAPDAIDAELSRVRRTLAADRLGQPVCRRGAPRARRAARRTDRSGHRPQRGDRLDRAADQPPGGGDRGAVQRGLRRDRRQVRRVLPAPLRRGLRLAADERGGRGGRVGRDRDRRAATRQAPPATGNAVGRRACAGRRRAALRHAEREPRPVLHPRRGGRRARRGQHRPLRRRAPAACAADRLRGDHAQPRHHRDRRHDLRGDHDRCRRVPPPLPPARRPAGRGGRRMMPRPRREPTGLGLRPSPGGLGSRLRALLGRSATAVQATWDELEEALIAADVGAETTLELVAATRRRVGAGAPGEAVRGALAEEITARLERAGSGRFELGALPAVILVVGVNGSGKTTTIAKLGARFLREGHSVVLAAADTFRAAAVEQLRLWGEELGVTVVSQRPGADPGAVAFDAMAAAESRGIEVVIIDTAGRLQSKTQLMAELAKIRRVIERRAPGQPRHVLLVLDATTGQNGLSQAEAFGREAGVTGIVLTKLDGTAKGGVAVAIADRLGVPIVFAGTGELVDALAPFDPQAYVEWLLAA